MTARSHLSQTPSALPSPRDVQAPARRARAQALALTLLACAAAPAGAQQPLRNLVAFGAISVPEFEGSSDRTVAPFAVGRLDFGDRGSLRLAGQGLQYNLLGSESAWAVGPVLSFRPARDGDVNDAVVRRLREVDAAAEGGVFVEYGIRDTWSQGDRLALGAEAKAGKGTQVALTASYLAAKQGPLQFGVDARAVFANTKYMDTYFSVDADNARRSGLPQYAAGSGAKSVGLGFTGSYDMSSEWTLIGRVGFTRLLGDARDSPIVQLRGKANGVSAGLALGYRF